MSKQSQKFNQETPNYRTNDVGNGIDNPYLQARQEWHDRYGNLVAQASNWRLIAVLSIFAVIILLVLLIISFVTNKDKVFVAEVTNSGKIVNVSPLMVQYHPTKAQEEYFISNFIKLVRELPLDPVVAKKNWVNAYHFLTSRSSKILSDYLQKNNPIASLGKQTVEVDVTDVNPVSENTFQVDWVEKITEMSGQKRTQQNYSGVFTVVLKQPTSQRAILHNPLGIYIVDFNISQRET
ncbi:MAG: conjugal transfer protein TrbF [Gammaproteobacteria bacterium]|jgi:type IV secretion system protein VirB5